MERKAFGRSGKDYPFFPLSPANYSVQGHACKVGGQEGGRDVAFCLSEPVVCPRVGVSACGTVVKQRCDG